MRYELRRVSSILWAPRPVAMIRSAYINQQIVVCRGKAFPFGEGGTPLGVTEEVCRHRNSPKCKCFRNLLPHLSRPFGPPSPKGRALDKLQFEPLT